jgi:hypothetical protein
MIPVAITAANAPAGGLASQPAPRTARRRWSWLEPAKAVIPQASGSDRAVWFALFVPARSGISARALRRPTSRRLAGRSATVAAKIRLPRARLVEATTALRLVEQLSPTVQRHQMAASDGIAMPGHPACTLQRALVLSRVHIVLRLLS